MSDHKLVRRLSDSKVFEAVRYGNKDGSWDKDCINRIATFVLGLNPDVSTTIENERMLDVVKPVLSSFDPANGLADLEISDWTASGNIFLVRLGDWVLKNPHMPFIAVKAYHFENDFEDIPVEIPDLSDLEYLTQLIYRNLPAIGRTHEAHARQEDIAKNVATEILRAGWKRPL